MRKEGKLFFLFFLFIGCSKPIEKGDISISIFKNNTKEYGLEEELNLAIVEEIMNDRNFRITNKGDFTLKGSIIDYKKTPIAWTSDIITEYRLSMSVEFEVNDKDSLLLKEKASSSIIYSQGDDEKEERKRLLKRISRNIVNRLYDL